MAWKRGNPSRVSPLKRSLFVLVLMAVFMILRKVASVAMDRQVAEGVHAMVVPGSELAEKQAEEEGLERRHWSVAVRHLNI